MQIKNVFICSYKQYITEEKENTDMISSANPI